MTLAAIDRLVHHATILEMNVESYRRRARRSSESEGVAAPLLTRQSRKRRPPNLIDAPRQSIALAKPARHGDHQLPVACLFSS